MAWKTPNATPSEGPVPRYGSPSNERTNGANGREVVCGGCGRTRAFGVRCQCERLTPDGEPVERVV